MRAGLHSPLGPISVEERAGVITALHWQPGPASASRTTGSASGCAPQAQVLRNHSCGSTRSGAASGPRFSIVMRTARSSGAAFAYSTNTSK